MHSHHAPTSKRRIPKLAVAALALAAAAGLSSATPAGAQQGPPGDEPTFDICHRTNSNANPYNFLDDVPESAVDGVGPADHFGEHTGPLWNDTLKESKTEWGDVIPPVDGFHEGSEAYLALGEDADAFIANNCSTPPVPTFDVTLSKVTTGGTAPSASTDFTFTVSCESGTVVSPVNVAAEDAPVTVATGVAEDDNCTITETVKNGATSVTYQVNGGNNVAPAGDAVTFGVGAAVGVIATNAYPEPVVVATPPADVAGVVVTPAPAPAPAQVAGAQLARTGSPAGYWYLLAGFAFLLGGVTLYGSTARRLLHINR